MSASDTPFPTSAPATPPLPPRRFVMLVTLPLSIFRDLLKVVGLSLFVFGGLMLAVMISQMAVRDGASVGAILMTLPYWIPALSPEVLPFAMVTGVLVTYGRLVADREYLAAQAGGVHPLWLAVPAGVLAALAVFVVVFLNEVAMEPAAARIARMLVDDEKNIAQRQLQRSRSVTMKSGGEVLAICRLPEDILPPDDKRVGIDIAWFRPPLSSTATAAAVDGVFDGARVPWDPRYPWPVRRILGRDHAIEEIRRRPSDGLMQQPLEVRGAAFFDMADGDPLRADFARMAAAEYVIDLNRGGRKLVREGDLRFSSMTALHAGRRRMTPDIEERFDFAPGKAPAVVSLAGLPREDPAYRIGREYNAIQASLQAKVALAVSCFCFAFVGVPMGLAVRGQSGAATNFILGVGLSTIYYVVMHTMQKQVADGRMDWPMLWLPNALLLVLGLVLVRRARRMAM